jgi:hypothetical protein
MRGEEKNKFSDLSDEVLHSHLHFIYFPLLIYWHSNMYLKEEEDEKKIIFYFDGVK